MNENKKEKTLKEKIAMIFMIAFNTVIFGIFAFNMYKGIAKLDDSFTPSQALKCFKLEDNLFLMVLGAIVNLNYGVLSNDELNANEKISFIQKEICILLALGVVAILGLAMSGGRITGELFFD